MFYVDKPVPQFCVSKNEACPYKEICSVYQRDLKDPGVPFSVFEKRCINRRHPECPAHEYPPREKKNK